MAVLYVQRGETTRRPRALDDNYSSALMHYLQIIPVRGPIARKGAADK